MPPPNTVYQAFTKQGVQFNVGDTVMIKNDAPPNFLDFVAAVEKIFTDNKGDVYLNVRWYYRPQELPLGKQPWHSVNELIESDHKDQVSVQTINSKCKILKLEEYLSNKGSEDKPQADKTATEGEEKKVEWTMPEFFSRSFFYHKKKTYQKELPTYCFCQKPFNPDRLLVACDECKAWFHGDCVNLKEKPATGFQCHKCRGEEYPSVAVKSKPKAKKSKADDDDTDD